MSYMHHFNNNGMLAVSSGWEPSWDEPVMLRRVWVTKRKGSGKPYAYSEGKWQ